MKRFTACALALACVAFASHAAAEKTVPIPPEGEVVAHYAALVHASYADALAAAKRLEADIAALLENPGEETLKQARAAWVAARVPYLQTEVYRFYQGPIDFSDPATGKEGPEGRLNAWPLNEAYIDYVKGAPNSGIIADTSVPITRATLLQKNQSGDEANVATGYHAIEFLLWGQDFSTEGPGARPASDYLPGDPIRNRRRDYLKEVTGLLVDDLQFLVDSWKPGGQNYAARFIATPRESLGRILTGMATLSGFELASERMATALDSGDQEDEHSCFSDTTYQDFVMNARGIGNVYLGRYAQMEGKSLYDLLRARDPKLADAIRNRLAETERLVAAIPQPIDQVLASPASSEGRQAMEKAVASLQAQAELLKQAGKPLGVDVKIVTE